MSRKIQGGASSPVFVDGGNVGLKPDALAGKLVSKSESVTANTVLAIPIPEWANYFKIYPVNIDKTRFAIDEDPVAESTTAYVVGDYVMVNTWEIRIISESEIGAGHQLRIRPITTGSVLVVFGKMG
jgi:hypothetical protein